MNQGKFNAAYNGLNAMAKKVYQAVPIAEAWNVAAIIGEMHRLGFSADHRVVSGCMDTLAQNGLVTEPKRGFFLRTEVREKKQTTEIKAVHALSQPTIANKDQQLTSTTITAKKPAAKTPIDKLADIAARVAELSQTCKALADEVTNVAIEIEEGSKATAEELAQLRQLKTLLKTFGN